MGLKARREDLKDALGVLFVMEDGHPVAALSLCPYSEEQVTLWGPVYRNGELIDLGMLLLENVKAVLRKNNFVSYRVLIDTRNRDMRNFYNNAGLQKFDDNILFSRSIHKPTELPHYPVDMAQDRELDQVQHMLNISFPDNGHCEPGLKERAAEGYVHYVIRVKKRICGCAVVSRRNKRSWLSLVCIDPAQRGHGYSRELLNGIINNEYAKGSRDIAFEVLAGNTPALAVYKACGFERQWSATIYTGPL
jgi:GNAT superfamily N-acetyltransferase